MHPRLLPTLERLTLAAGLNLLAFSSACRSAYTPTPQGAVAPAPSASPMAYANDVTAANGWTPPPDRVTSAVDLSHLTPFRMLSAKQGGMRVLVYYNSALSSQVSAWRTPSRQVLELDFDEVGPTGRSRGTRTLALSTQYAVDEVAGQQDLDALLAHRIEASLTRLLLAADTRVIDKAMLFRKTAAATRARTFSEAEIRALGNDVDLLIEVAFIPGSPSPDGFEVGVKAVRTKDARLLAWSTSANTVAPTVIVAQAGRGFRERREAVSLDDRATAALQQALEQVARAY